MKAKQKDEDEVSDYEMSEDGDSEYEDSDYEMSEDEVSEDEVPLTARRKSAGAAKKKIFSGDDEEDCKPVSQTQTLVDAVRLHKVPTAMIVQPR